MSGLACLVTGQELVGAGRCRRLGRCGRMDAWSVVCAECLGAHGVHSPALQPRQPASSSLRSLLTTWLQGKNGMGARARRAGRGSRNPYPRPSPLVPIGPHCWASQLPAYCRRHNCLPHSDAPTRVMQATEDAGQAGPHPARPPGLGPTRPPEWLGSRQCQCKPLYLCPSCPLARMVRIPFVCAVTPRGDIPHWLERTL